MGRPIWNYIELVSKDCYLHCADEETERSGILPSITQQISISIRFRIHVCCSNANYLLN